MLFSLILSVTQLIWSYTGADQAFLEAPKWITITRGIAVIVFVLPLLIIRSKNEQRRYTCNLDFWMGIFASYIFVRGVYIESQIPKVTTFASYLVLSLLIYHLRTQEVDVSSIQIPLRILVYGSIAEAFLLPNLAFTESLSRFGFIFHFRRFCGLVGHPSLFAFLAFLYLLSVLSMKAKYWKIEFFVILLLLLLANTASVLICLPLLFFTSDKVSSYFRLLKILASVAPLISLFVLTSVLRKEVSNSAIMGADALNSRPLIWHWAFEVWHQSPMFGLSSQSQNYALGYSRSIYWLHAHSQVLQELLAGGLIRLSLASIIFFILWRLAIRELNSLHPQPGIVFILFICQSTSEIPFTFNTIDFRFLTFLIFLLFYFVKFDKRRQYFAPKPTPL